MIRLPWTRRGHRHDGCVAVMSGYQKAQAAAEADARDWEERAMVLAHENRALKAEIAALVATLVDLVDLRTPKQRTDEESG